MTIFRAGIRLLGLAWLTAGVAGCVSPHAYYCQDGCGPLFPSARMAPSGDWAADGRGTPGASGRAEPARGPCGGDFWPSLLGCRAGCGRMYWGEWAYDPPDACDACNDGGQWVGPRCRPPGGWFTFWQGLCGMRRDPCAGPAESGCDMAFDGEAWDGEVFSDEASQYGSDILREPDVEATRPQRPSAVTTAREFRRTAQPVPTPAVPRDPQSRLVRRNRPPGVK